jgi:hypothetical protein
MKHEIDTSKPLELNWAAKDEERIIQNVRNLISTWRYEVAYDRTKGLDPGIMDKPTVEASAQYISEIYRLVEDYEPNAEVKSVTPIGIDDEGQIDFKVVIEI